MTNGDFVEKIRQLLKYRCNLNILGLLKNYENCQEVTIEGENYITFTNNNDNSMYLPLRKHGPPHPVIRCSPEMVEFYAVFDGLAESEPPLAGYFWPSEKGHRFPHLSKYSDCPIIFAALNGDQLIQMPDGGFAWFSLEEDSVKKFASNFPALIQKYVEHHKIGDGYPFDSYGRD